jgi:hypothetical protein
MTTVNEVTPQYSAVRTLKKKIWQQFKQVKKYTHRDEQGDNFVFVENVNRWFETLLAEARDLESLLQPLPSSVEENRRLLAASCRDLLFERDHYKDSAEKWKESYEKLKAKYEPSEGALTAEQVAAVEMSDAYKAWIKSADVGERTSRESCWEAAWLARGALSIPPAPVKLNDDVRKAYRWLTRHLALLDENAPLSSHWTHIQNVFMSARWLVNDLKPFLGDAPAEEVSDGK